MMVLNWEFIQTPFLVVDVPNPGCVTVVSHSVTFQSKTWMPACGVSARIDIAPL